MTFERWFVICRPLSNILKFQTKHHLFIALIILAIYSVALNIPRAWESSLSIDNINGSSQNGDNKSSASISSSSSLIVIKQWNDTIACNDYYQYGYRVGICIGINIIIPIIITAVMNGMAVYVLFKGRHALKVHLNIFLMDGIISCIKKVGKTTFH